MARHEILFSGSDGGLWQTNGSAGGTFEVTSGTVFGGPQLNPSNFLAFDGRVLFWANNAAFPTLWITNGAADGTHSGVIPSSPVIASGPAFELTVLGNQFLFSHSDQANDVGLWMSNGTPAGTIELGGFGSTGIGGVSPAGLDPAYLTALNGKVLFAGADAGSEVGLWVTDGTVGGTTELGGFGSSGVGGVDPLNLATVGGKVLFEGLQGPNQYSVWVTDGTVGGSSELVSGIVGTHGGSPDFTPFGLEVAFEGADFGLWVTDETPPGTTELGGHGSTGISGASAGGLLAVANPDFTVFNGEVLFEGENASGVPGLWVTNGLALGTSELAGITGANAAGIFSNGVTPDFTVFNGEVLFAGRDVSNHIGLWVTNGTDAGTTELGGFGSTGISGVSPAGLSPTGFTLHGGKALFGGNDSNGHYGLWVTDGTVAGTSELTGMTPLGGTAVNSLAAVTLPTVKGDLVGNGESGIVWVDTIDNPSDAIVDYWNVGTNQGFQSTFVGTGSATMNALATGDFNNDGIADILWMNPGNDQVGTWLMNDGQPSWQPIDQSSATVQFAGVGDFNGDGTTDILWSNPTNNLVGEWQMNDGHDTWVLVGQGSTTMNIAGIGDFNGDGKSDILWENPTNGLVGMWAMNGATPTWSLIDQGSTSMQIAGIGDFNGDGTDDILWRNASNGGVGYWAMNNGQDTWNFIGYSTTSYNVIGTGDYYGTGTSDILWKNSATDQIGDWQMTNGVATWHLMGNAPNGYDVSS